MSGIGKEVQRKENEEKYIRNKTKKKGISEVLVVQIATGFHWAVPDQDLWLGGHFAYAVPIIRQVDLLCTDILQRSFPPILVRRKIVPSKMPETVCAC